MQKREKGIVEATGVKDPTIKPIEPANLGSQRFTD